MHRHPPASRISCTKSCGVGGAPNSSWAPRRWSAVPLAEVAALHAALRGVAGTCCAAGARAAAGRAAGVASYAAERPATLSLRMAAGRGAHAGPRGGLAGGKAAHASIGGVLAGGRRLRGPRAHAAPAASMAAMMDVVGVPVYHRAHSGRRVVASACAATARREPTTLRRGAVAARAASMGDEGPSWERADDAQPPTEPWEPAGWAVFLSMCVGIYLMAYALPALFAFGASLVETGTLAAAKQVRLMRPAGRVWGSHVCAQ
eukprot:353679-Chlamydomonas_euryale.AAC.6